MPCEFSWSPPANPSRLWVFESRQNKVLQSLMDSLYTSVNASSSRNRTITKEMIKAVIKKNTEFRNMGRHLIQFWAPVRTGDRISLTTTDQPFDLTEHSTGLYAYRRLCLSSILVAVDVNEMGEEEENNLAPVARAFRHGVREICTDVRDYHEKEYCHRDYIVEHGMNSYCALPIFDSDGEECIGVLEILSTSCDSVVGSVEYQLEKMELTCHVNSPFSYNFKYSQGRKRAQNAMQDICRSYQLPFAQIWAATSTTGCIERLSYYIPKPLSSPESIHRYFGAYRKWEGKGVVGKAFSSRSACFCNNISQLSVSVYPMVLNLRKLGLAKCFAVCLQSTYADDLFYILEFFLPRSDIDPRNFVGMLVATLKGEIQSSMGTHVHKLGEKLFVEVIKVSSDDELDSFEVCDTAHIRSTLGSKVTRGERNVLGNYSQLQPSSPFSVQGSGLGMQVNLGPWIGVRSCSQVESNSPSSVQEMSLGLHLGLRPLGRFRKDSMDQQNSASPFQEMSLGMYLDLGPKLEPEDDTISSSSVRNYSVVQRRSPTPGRSLFISNSDSDFTDIDAALQILRRAKRRRGILTFDMSNG